MAYDMEKRRWLIDGWKWWRYNHHLGLFESIAMTFRSEFWWHIQEVYAWFSLRWSWIKRKYMPWTKHARIMREVKQLEKKLFKEQ
jgi:hypothetical protein